MANYLTTKQNAHLRRWERWNRNYFLFAFTALIIILVFSSQLGLSSADDWGGLGVILVLLVAPIVAMQLKLACPACSEKLGWQAKLMAPEQCKYCESVLRVSVQK
jgi:hypothetical protein